MVIGLVATAVACAAFAFEQVRGRAPGASTWDVTFAWSLGIACLVAIAALGRDPAPPIDPVAASPRWRATPYELVGGWILLVAAVARLLVLDRFPTVLDGDEGTFLTTAYRARHGDLANPWGTGVLSSVDGYYALEGRVSLLFGDGVAAYRTLSAALGIVTVLAVWRLGRRALGEIAGLVAMGVVALMPLHLWASRSALNNVSHAAVAAVLLWLLDRAITGRRRADALGAGIVVGLGAFGYVGGTVFVVVALAVLLTVAVLPAFEIGLRAAASIAGWLLLGSLVVAAPLLGHYAAAPDRFAGRIRQVDGGLETIADRLDAVFAGLVYPVLDRHGTRADFYRVDGPFLGWVLGPLAVGGVVVWAWWTFRRGRSARRGPPVPTHRCEPLLVTTVLLSAIVSQSEAMSSQRWLAMTPLWALGVGTALTAAGRWLVARTGWRPAPLIAAGALLLGGLGFASAAGFYDEDQQLRAYGDRRTTGAYDLGWRLAAADDDVAVLSLGLPFQPYSGFGNLRFLVPDWNERVVEVEPLAVDGSPGAAAPVLTSGQIAVIAAERIPTDVCPLQAANPGAELAEAQDRYGTVLYVVASPDRLPLPSRPTPAGTVLRPAVTC